MNTGQVNRILKRKIPKAFIGVYARNTLPKRVPFYPCSFVVNLDSQSKPGSHWIAIHFDGNATASYMDSFGLPPFVPHLSAFMKRNSRKIWINRKPLQHPLSESCGKYSIVYLIHRNQGKSNKSYLSKFKSPSYNEKYIGRRFNQMRT